MGFPTLYKAIRKMMLNEVLDTQVARDIVRKSGALSGEGGATGSPRMTRIWNGVNYAAPSRNLGYEPQGIQRGAYFFPPVDSPPTLQYSLTNLSNVAYVRVLISWSGYDTAFSSKVGVIPAYTNELRNPGSLSDWLAPDGRTLAEWDADLVAGTALWHPPGAAMDPVGFGESGAQGTVITNGPWHAAPVDGLDSLENVLIGCGVLIRNPVTMDIQAINIQAAAAPTSDAFNAYFFD